jgi:hypothetical protein
VNRFLWISLVISASVQAQQPSLIAKAIAALEVALSGNDWSGRRTAFYDLLTLGETVDMRTLSHRVSASVSNLVQTAPEEAEPLRDGLTSLLRIENSYSDTARREFLASGGTRGQLTEEYTDYYGDVVVAVAALNDGRTLDALLGAIRTGHPAISTVATFGIPTVDAVVPLLSASDGALRGAATLVLLEILKPQNFKKVNNPVTILKIRSALNTATLDVSQPTRSFALEALVTLSGASVTRPFQMIQIDIKPDDPNNPVNPRSKGVLPVAVLSTPSFDATTLDFVTVKFGPGRAMEAHKRVHIENVNSDNRQDAVFHFETSSSGIICTDTAAFLVGLTRSGETVLGSDSIRTVGCN